MKNNTSFEYHNFVRAASELEAAQRYALRYIPVIGRSKTDAQLLNRIKMPALPLLQSNREQRMNLIKPCLLVRLFGSAKSKCKMFKDTIAQAAMQEKQKQMLSSKMNLKLLLQDPLPHESVACNAMTMKEFKQWCYQT